MNRRHVLILTALTFEARPIAHALGLRFLSKTMAEGTTGRTDIRLMVVGPGARRLPPAPVECDLVLMAGLAGGLTADLRRGDVVIDEQSDPAAGGPVRRGPIATVGTLVGTPDAKRDLHRATGALVADMENAVARGWAGGLGLPFVGLRAVSDTVNESLDPATLRVLNADGGLSPLRLLREVFRRPSVLLPLWRLRTARTVARGLAEEVGRTLTRLEGALPNGALADRR